MTITALSRSARASTRLDAGLRQAAIVVALALGFAVPCLADEFSDDLKARRARVMEQLGPEAMLVLWSAPPRLFSNDTDFEFRQDSDLYYLSGVTQEDTTLVLMPGNQTQKSILFVRDFDPVREHWEGHSLTPDEARTLAGVDVVYRASELEPFMDAMFAGRPYNRRRTAPTEEYDAFFNALKAGKARLALLAGPGSLNAPLSPAQLFGRSVTERVVGVTIQDATGVIHGLRQIKTPYEQKVLTRSVEISSDAHIAGMRAARPDAFEYQVEAAIEHVYLANGAMTPGYPSIVGSGPNATILHYNTSGRQMKAGELLLVDAAGAYQLVTGDITRTYPVSGRFSAEQRTLYELVLAAQEAGMKAAKVGGTTNDIEKASADVLRDGLLKLGLITDATGDQFRLWYTHGVCHWIGLDVHDVGDYKRPLAPGMTFVIEPGVYIRPEALEHLPKTPANAAFIEKVRPMVEKYKHLGIRIEDSFLLTETGLQNLSAKVPRTIDQIERLMGGGTN
jgi:Xaa-Pro aminopeptidase